MAKIFDILISREYTDKNGEVKTQYYQAGVAFENKAGGMNLEIPDGLSISGRAVILPRKERAEGDGAEQG